MPLLPSRGLGPFRPPQHPARHLECPGLVVGRWGDGVPDGVHGTGEERAPWRPPQGQQTSATAVCSAAPPWAELTFGVCLCPTPAPRPPARPPLSLQGDPHCERTRACSCVRVCVRVRASAGALTCKVSSLLGLSLPPPSTCPRAKGIWPRRSRSPLPWHHDCSQVVPPSSSPLPASPLPPARRPWRPTLFGAWLLSQHVVPLASSHPSGVDLRSQLHPLGFFAGSGPGRVACSTCPSPPSSTRLAMRRRPERNE